MTERRGAAVPEAPPSPPPAVIALAGEVVSDYSLRLKAQYGWEDTWVAGYSNDVFGYTPSARVLREGGYEADQSGYVSQFSPAIEELIIEKVAALMARVAAPKSDRAPAHQ